MGRKVKVYMNALNIKTQPHDIENYNNLFWEAFNLRRKIKISGDRYGIIGSCHYINSQNRSEGLFGELFFFIDIDPSQDWYNIESEKKATDEELQNIRIPQNLKPHLKKFQYFFFPKYHRLIFEVKKSDKTVSHNTVNKLFNNLLFSHKIREQYSISDIIIEQSTESLEKIYKLSKISKFIITITRPNPDSPGSYANKVRKRLDRQNTQKLEMSYTAQRDESFSPDSETKKIANLALSDGQVDAIGYDESGFRKTESTLKTPNSDFFEYDNKDSFFDIFLHNAKSFLIKIININE